MNMSAGLTQFAPKYAEAYLKGSKTEQTLLTFSILSVIMQEETF